MAQSAREEIIGEIPVVAQLALGVEQLRLVLTNRRLIVARAGKKGAGSLASVLFLGRFALKNLEKGSFGSARKGTWDRLNPDEVLRANKDNFQILYVDVVHVEIAGTRGDATITLLTKDDKLLFSSTRSLDSVLGLFNQVLHEKVITMRQRQESSLRKP